MVSMGWRGAVGRLAVAAMLLGAPGASAQPGDRAQDAPTRPSAEPPPGEPAPPSSQRGQREPVTPERFVRYAVLNGITAVQLAEIVLETANNEDVLAFARAVTNDHQAAVNRLRSLAPEMNVRMPSDQQLRALAESEQGRPAANPGGNWQLSPRERGAIERLRQQTSQSAEFQFLNEMAQDHQRAIQVYQRVAAELPPQSPLAKYVEETLPVISQHYETAVKLAGMFSGIQRSPPVRPLLRGPDQKE